MKKAAFILTLAAALLVAGQVDARKPKKAKKAVVQVKGAQAVPMGKIGKKCRYKGKKLWGKVKIVKSFPDFKVKYVSSFPGVP